MRIPSPPHDSLTFVRCRIEGRFNGVNFIYEDPIGEESLAYHHKEDKEEQLSIGIYYWGEGTMSDDSNRIRFVPVGLLMDLEDDEFIFNRHNEYYSIEIKTITPLEGDFPIINLNEY